MQKKLCVWVLLTVALSILSSCSLMPKKTKAPEVQRTFWGTPQECIAFLETAPGSRYLVEEIGS